MHGQQLLAHALGIQHLERLSHGKTEKNTVHCEVIRSCLGLDMAPPFSQNGWMYLVENPSVLSPVVSAVLE